MEEGEILAWVIQLVVTCDAYVSDDCSKSQVSIILS